MALVLHGYWRATAPYRVRIALALKGLDYQYRPVDLRAGEQGGAAYRRLNPQALTPVLEHDGLVLTQSTAIIEWLEETCPRPPLLPRSPDERALVRAMAAIVACEIHPLNNLRVLKALAGLGHPIGGAAQRDWGARWIVDGLAALEPLVARHGAGFAFGAEPGMADCFIVPQVWAAGRFDVDLSPFPALRGLMRSAAGHPAFAAAAPERQPDAPAPECSE